ncbi:hypothetical protein [Tenacibaculum sp. SG-28]|uniref:hypothetical protein n=1 Tax=Tenacibaculum sp. SG-28 TaxID=754426 RepID=UPI000CF44BFF|nr:hypothetical protein [Tenacibaculum sp. SG-28]PQJ20795.1 hypothetical protein BSU00_10990 [Tenacibaculum sp. SG-28]
MKIKQKIVQLALQLCLLCILFSCDANNDLKNKTTILEEDIASEVTFKEIEKSKVTNSKWCGHIVSWDEWGRKSKDCRGWGLCNASWFQPCKEKKNTSASESKKIKSFATEVYREKNTEEYFILLALNKPIPKGINSNDLLFRIDKDIILETEKSLGHKLTFKTGVYKFDETIDEFGGYKIFLY